MRLAESPLSLALLTTHPSPKGRGISTIPLGREGIPSPRLCVSCCWGLLQPQFPKIDRILQRTTN